MLIRSNYPYNSAFSRGLGRISHFAKSSRERWRIIAIDTGRLAGAADLNRELMGFGESGNPHSGKGEHDPAEQQGDADKGHEDLGAVNHLLPQRLLAENRKYHGDKEGEQNQCFKMGEDHFLLFGKKLTRGNSRFLSRSAGSE